MDASSRTSNRPRHSPPTEPWRSIWRLVSLVAKDDPSNITETAVYIQVRTVVWEDGVVRPLLPDSLFAVSPRVGHALACPPAPLRAARTPANWLS
jgi:hypothetical protein